MSTEYSKKRINVLVAADHAGYKGSIAGVGRYLLNVLPRVDRKRFKMILIILRDTATLKPAFEKEGLKLIQLKRKKFDPFTLLDILKIIKEEEIDVLHLHQYGSSNFGRIAGKIIGVPTILHAHGPVPYFNYPLYQRIADRLLAKFNDYAIAVSEAVKAECISTRAFNPKKIHVILNGIPLEDFKPLKSVSLNALKRRWEIPPDSSIVGTVTRLYEDKGTLYILEAAAEVLSVLPKTYFFLVGDGPLLEKLKDLAQRLGIEKKVIFAGFQADVAAMMSLFDFMVIASISEGHPQTLLEAMAMGKAVVATEAGGIKEIIKHGENGLLVPTKNSSGLAEKIIFLLQNEQERIRMGVNAQMASHQFAIHRHVRNLEKFYTKMVGTSGD